MIVVTVTEDEAGVILSTNQIRLLRNLMGNYVSSLSEETELNNLFWELDDILSGDYSSEEDKEGAWFGRAFLDGTDQYFKLNGLYFKKVKEDEDS